MTYPLPERNLGDSGHPDEHDAVRDRINALTPDGSDPDALVPSDRLGSGTPTAGTYLRGDGAWASAITEADPAELSPEGVPIVINVTVPPDTVTTGAAAGDNSNATSAANTVALQEIFDWVGANDGRVNTHIIYFPGMTAAGAVAVYRVDEPLRVWSNTRIRGFAKLAPSDSFDWTTHPHAAHALYNPAGNAEPGDIALMELWNPTNGRGGFSRIMLWDLTIDCRSQVGSIGALMKFQQPAWTYKFRVDNADIGMVVWGQQAEFFLPEIINCKVGLYLGSPSGNFDGLCKFMSFYSLNIEQYYDAGVRANTDGPNWFYNLHFESAKPDPRIVMDMQNGRFMVKGGWATHGDSAGVNHMFVIGDTDPLPGPKSTSYSIEDFDSNSTNTTGQLMIDDKVRGFTRIVGLTGRIDSFRAAHQNDSQIDYDAAFEVVGDDGGFVRIGGVQGFGAPSAPAGHSGAQLTVQANTSQDEPMARFRDSAGTTRFLVNEQGQPVPPSYTNANRPTATTLEAGSMIWNTDDNAPNFASAGGWRDASGAVT